MLTVRNAIELLSKMNMDLPMIVMNGDDNEDQGLVLQIIDGTKTEELGEAVYLQFGQIKPKDKKVWQFGIRANIPGVTIYSVFDDYHAAFEFATDKLGLNDDDLVGGISKKNVWCVTVNVGGEWIEVRCEWLTDEHYRILGTDGKEYGTNLTNGEFVLRGYVVSVLAEGFWVVNENLAVGMVGPFAAEDDAKAHQNFLMIRGDAPGTVLTFEKAKFFLIAKHPGVVILTPGQDRIATCPF